MKGIGSAFSVSLSIPSECLTPVPLTVQNGKLFSLIVEPRKFF